MKKSLMGWLLMGLLSAGVSLVAAAGCTSTRGACEGSCNTACDVSETCEDYIPGDFDVDKCHRDCAENCDDTLDKKEAECDHGVNLHGDAVSACNESLGELRDACANHDDSHVLSNLGEVGDNCTEQKFYSCN